MKSKVSVYYAKVPNMGDLLNRDIIEKCFGYDVERRTYLTGKVSGIGSGLGNYTYEEGKWKNMLKFISGIFFPEAYIWGTGFVRYKDADTKFYKKNMHFCAVRGELSRKRIEKMLGHDLDIPTGDAGILSSFLLDQMPEKKYKVGIIAHYKEQDEPAFQTLCDKFQGSKFIDVRNEPEEVTQQIAECEVILSSSLHGLIIADSLRIPNRHIVVTDNLLGDGFKFDDYYSAYGLEHSFTDLNIEEIDSLEEVCDQYRITDEMADTKKKLMLKSFPFPPLSGSVQ
ncbi:polysaccharide pyruvyl transferase family protein [Anaerostipes butyraticus]|uniref:polysaccharide pyruvyl transferase family protein n=1 Tax=Anaerostipes butyraticus TaxID=645466 RepID=UPI0032095217